LEDLLSYHVRFVEAAIFAIDLSDNLLVRPKNGEDLVVTLPLIAVNGNKVDAADIEVSNGVIHIIDGVLLPCWVSNSISDRVDTDSDLYTFLSLLVMAGLVDAFAGSGELTLVAPINSTFAKLSEAIFDLLTSAVGRELLTQTLPYHVLHGVFELYTSNVRTLDGGTVTICVGRSGLFFNDAKAFGTGLLANNGVVHKIDGVLNPNDGR
jgi:transforming growth factor-beta-induced protein